MGSCFSAVALTGSWEMMGGKIALFLHSICALNRLQLKNSTKSNLITLESRLQILLSKLWHPSLASYRLILRSFKNVSTHHMMIQIGKMFVLHLLRIGPLWQQL